LEDGQQRPCEQELKKIKPITTKWVFKKKAQQEGSIRYRARCVARGFTQIPGVDFIESFAPVASDTSIKLLIGIHLHNNHPKLNWVLETFEIEAAKIPILH
jgi:Reverse transcriptase (RNA-dependent DNA polymerase)